MGIFLVGRGSPWWPWSGQLVDLDLRPHLAPHFPISPLTPSGQRNCASWASQPQKSVTLPPQPGGGTKKKFTWTCGGIRKKNYGLYKCITWSAAFTHSHTHTHTHTHTAYAHLYLNANCLRNIRAETLKCKLELGLGVVRSAYFCTCRITALHLITVRDTTNSCFLKLLLNNRRQTTHFMQTVLVS